LREENENKKLRKKQKESDLRVRKKNCLREENEKKIEKETKLIGSESEEKKNCAIWKKKNL
jgi:hypothetical protein